MTPKPRIERFRLVMLLGLLAVEIILIVSLRQRGWVATCEPSQYNIDAIGKLPKLVDVSFLGIDMKGTNLSSIASLKTLKSLHLDDCRNLDDTPLQELRRKWPKVRLWLNGRPANELNSSP